MTYAVNEVKEILPDNLINLSNGQSNPDAGRTREDLSREQQDKKRQAEAEISAQCPDPKAGKRRLQSPVKPYVEPSATTLTFLQTPNRVAKISRVLPGGAVERVAVNIKTLQHSAHVFELADLDASVKQIRRVSKKDDIFLILGSPIDGQREKITRKKDNYQDVPHHLIVVDVDKFPCAKMDGRNAATTAMRLLPEEFKLSRCHWQLTASHGVTGPKGKLEAHVRLFFWADRPVSLAEMNVWLAGRCVDQCGVDMSIYRVSQPVFISMQILGEVDPFKAERWGVIEGAEDTVAVPTDLSMRTIKAVKPERAAGGATAGNVDMKQLRSAVLARNAGMGRDPWLQQLMGIHAATGGSDEGLALAEEWSIKGFNYELGCVEKAWDSFTLRPAGEGIGAATIFARATEEEGWNNEKSDKKPRGAIFGATTEGDDDLPEAGNDNDEPDPAAEAEVKTKKAPKPSFFGYHPIREMEDVPPTRWIVHGLFARGKYTILTGTSGTTKTGLALVEAMAVVTGRPEIAGWPDKARIERTSVLFISGEDDTSMLEERIGAIRRHWGIPVSQIDGTSACGAALHLACATKSQDGVGTVRRLTLAKYDDSGKHGVVNKADIKALINGAAEHKIGMIVLDPIKDMHMLDENRNQDMAIVQHALVHLASEADICVLIAAHSRKATKDEVTHGSKDITRGAGIFVDGSRGGRTLHVMNATEAKQYGKINRKQFFRSDESKQSLAAESEEVRWYERTSVPRKDGKGTVLLVLPVNLDGDKRAVRNEHAEAVANVLRTNFSIGESVLTTEVLKHLPVMAAEVNKASRQWNRKFTTMVMGSVDGSITTLSDGSRLLMERDGNKPTKLRLDTLPVFSATEDSD